MREEAGDILAIIGFMGAGKSRVGALLAAGLGMEFVDLDEVVCAGAGKSVGEIFASEGERGFRERESEALKAELEGGGKVIACGGGVVTRPENVRLLRAKSRVFLLHISPAVAAERLADAGGRPLLEGGELEEKVGRLMERRAGRYLEAAHEVIEVDDLGPEEVAEEIAARWRRFRSARREGNTPSL